MITAIDQLRQLKTRDIIPNYDYPANTLRYVVYVIPKGVGSDYLATWCPKKSCMHELIIGTPNRNGPVVALCPAVDSYEHLAHHFQSHWKDRYRWHMGHKSYVIDLDDPDWYHKWAKWYGDVLALHKQS